MELTYTFHGHACFSLEAGGTTLLFDPFLTGNPVAQVAADDVAADYILLSHGHFDHMPDAAAIATIWHLETLIGRRAGASTGTGLWAALQIVAELRREGRRGSVVGLLCDPGDRYLTKYYSPDWLAAQGIDIGPYLDRLRAFAETGEL